MKSACSIRNQQLWFERGRKGSEADRGGPHLSSVTLASAGIHPRYRVSRSPTARGFAWESVACSECRLFALGGHRNCGRPLLLRSVCGEFVVRQAVAVVVFLAGHSQLGLGHNWSSREDQGKRQRTFLNGFATSRHFWLLTGSAKREKEIAKGGANWRVKAKVVWNGNCEDCEDQVESRWGFWPCPSLGWA